MASLLISWIKSILHELRVFSSIVPSIYCDNIGLHLCVIFSFFTSRWNTLPLIITFFTTRLTEVCYECVICPLMINLQMYQQSLLLQWFIHLLSKIGIRNGTPPLQGVLEKISLNGKAFQKLLSDQDQSSNSCNLDKCSWEFPILTNSFYLYLYGEYYLSIYKGCSSRKLLYYRFSS